MRPAGRGPGCSAPVAQATVGPPGSGSPAFGVVPDGAGPIFRAAMVDPPMSGIDPPADRRDSDGLAEQPA